MAKIQVSIDGGNTFIAVESLRVEISGHSEETESLQFNFTHEGIICDKIVDEECIIECYNSEYIDL